LPLDIMVTLFLERGIYFSPCSSHFPVRIKIFVIVANEREKLDILDISACMFNATFSGAYLFGYAALAV